MLTECWSPPDAYEPLDAYERLDAYEPLDAYGPLFSYQQTTTKLTNNQNVLRSSACEPLHHSHIDRIDCPHDAAHSDCEAPQ